MKNNPDNIEATLAKPKSCQDKDCKYAHVPSELRIIDQE